MQEYETKELIDCYEKILEYIESLKKKKTEAEKGLENA